MLELDETERYTEAKEDDVSQRRKRAFAIRLGRKLKAS
jgi:hypothetical protein